MTFENIYRASVYVMLFLACLVLNVDATSDNRLAMLYPLAVALASALAYLTVDRNPKLGLSRNLANALAVGSVILCWIEYNLDEHLLLSLAHWLVYFQLIKTFLPKTIEDEWWLFVLGLMQVLVGAVMSQSDTVGVCLFAWVLSALWVLGLFYLHRESLRRRPAAGGEEGLGIAAGSGVAVAEPEGQGQPAYPGLFDMPFLFASVRVLAITLILGGCIFLLMPRRTAMGIQPRSGAPIRHLTGFDDEVQLGQLGEILENDSVVMSIETFDGNMNRKQPEGEPLWRGVSMLRYENGRWHRGRVISRDPSAEPRHSVPPEKLVIQRVKLEATDTNVLFALRPVLDVGSRDRYPPQINRYDGSLQRAETRPGPYDYEAVSAPDGDGIQPLEIMPAPDSRLLNALLQVPDGLKDRLRAIALRVAGRIPAGDRAGRARALESYLRDSGEFGYTLQMDVVNPDIDPVEDFLVNRKEGHCAYYASALTLLLRSIDIPARMVNGFKGGDWNELASMITVRQKHAHSWVEVLVGSRPSRLGDREQRPLWLTLDPTPSLPRDETVAKVGGVSPNVRLLSDFVRYVWVFYIAGFDAERQDRIVYQPIKRLVNQALNGYRMMAAWLRQAFSAVFHFPDVASFFSVRGFFVSFIALSVLAALGMLAARLWRRLRRWFRGPDHDAQGLSAGVSFYRRLAHLLAQCGLERTAAETPLEFARRASGFLTGRLSGDGVKPVADVPPQVVDAFYTIRFGHRELGAETVRQLETRLDALEASLNAE